MFRLMIRFYFRVGKAYGWTFPKWKAGLVYHLILSPLFQGSFLILGFALHKLTYGTLTDDLDHR
jgi:hypothetical protein